jgi:hypothetical protein
VEDADFIIPIVIDNQVHNVYVLKRPGVDNFMRRMGEIYEVVVFTASLATVRNLVWLVFVYTFWYIFPGAMRERIILNQRPFYWDPPGKRN